MIVGDARSMTIFYQVCVPGQYRWPWLMSNDILLQISKLRGLKKMLNILIDIRNIFFDSTPIT